MGGEERDTHVCMNLVSLEESVRSGSVDIVYVNLLSQPDGLGIVDQDPVPGGLLNLVEKMGEGIDGAGKKRGEGRKRGKEGESIQLCLTTD